MAKNIKVKICGMTSYQDSAYAIDCGADAIGFIFANSPRRITPANARSIIRRLPPLALKVGVFVDAPLEEVKSIVAYCGLNLAQLHGNESKTYFHSLCPNAIKAFKAKQFSVVKLIQQYGAKNFLLDSYDAHRYGGTGNMVNLDIARRASALGNMILAGGLTPDNVYEVIKYVNPYGVDVSSGVESNPGRKDKRKVRQFITAAKL